jgi:hypothetical protein
MLQCPLRLSPRKCRNVELVALCVLLPLYTYLMQHHLMETLKNVKKEKQCAAYDILDSISPRFHYISGTGQGRDRI